MKELTAAWAEIQRTLPREQPAARRSKAPNESSSRPRSGPRTEVLSDDECLDWFIGAWIEASYAADDPVSGEDVQRALEPFAVAARRSNFDAWRRRHARTLAIALAADQDRLGEIPADWLTYYCQLDDAEVDVVLLLLLEQVLADVGLDA
jgi:hypothetical protein